MVDYSEWFTLNQKGKTQINSIAIYRDLSAEVVHKLDNNLSVSEIIAWIRQRTIQLGFRLNPQTAAIDSDHPQI